MWIDGHWHLLLLLILPSPKQGEHKERRSKSRDEECTWLTAGLGVFLDLVSSFFSPVSFLPPKLDLGVEVWDLAAAAGCGVCEEKFFTIKLTERMGASFKARINLGYFGHSRRFKIYSRVGFSQRSGLKGPSNLESLTTGLKVIIFKKKEDPGSPWTSWPLPLL